MNKREAFDLVNLVCGEKIAQGAYRTVFEYRINPAWVIKHDNRNNHSNIFEHALWNEMIGTKLEQWLAPVEWISDDGYWLIQRRTEPIRRDELPAQVPAIFCDMKLENWGMLDGRPVCHDYGNSMVFSLVRSHGPKLVKAHWSDR